MQLLVLRLYLSVQLSKNSLSVCELGVVASKAFVELLDLIFLGCDGVAELGVFLVLEGDKRVKLGHLGLQGRELKVLGLESETRILDVLIDVCEERLEVVDALILCFDIGLAVREFILCGRLLMRRDEPRGRRSVAIAGQWFGSG